MIDRSHQVDNPDLKQPAPLLANFLERHGGASEHEELEGGKLAGQLEDLVAYLRLLEIQCFELLVT